jgi:hypothetical protein
MYLYSVERMDGESADSVAGIVFERKCGLMILALRAARIKKRVH